MPFGRTCPGATARWPGPCTGPPGCEAVRRLAARKEEQGVVEADPHVLRGPVVQAELEGIDVDVAVGREGVELSPARVARVRHVQLLELRERLEAFARALLRLGQVHVDGTPVARGSEDVLVADDPVANLRVPAVAAQVSDALGELRELEAVDRLACVLVEVDEFARQVESCRWARTRRRPAPTASSPA